MEVSPEYIEDSSDESSLDSDESCESWISQYCSMPGNEFYCPVNIDFALDRFNLTGLGHDVPHAQAAYQRIISEKYYGPSGKDNLVSSVKLLYGLIHARFIISQTGMRLMKMKYKEGEFGKCPRVLCKETHLLPVGLHDVPGRGSVCLFCPHCEDIYNAPSTYSHIDGAFFGTTFPHLFLQNYPYLRPMKSNAVYAPKIFGFKVGSVADLDPEQARLLPTAAPEV